MAQYLAEEEIGKYCTNVAGVNINDVIIASELITSYLGKTFDVKEAIESVNINNKHRGKLNHTPVVDIIEVREYLYTPLGASVKQVDKSNIFLDLENDGYFYYTSQVNPFTVYSFDIPCCNNAKKRITVKYSYGYEEVPETIKVVCGMLAQNIRQLNSFVGFKKLNTLDYTVEMANPTFFTDDMRAMLNQYR